MLSFTALTKVKSFKDPAGLDPKLQNWASYTARNLSFSTGPEPPVSTGRTPGTAWSVLNAPGSKGTCSTGQ